MSIFRSYFSKNNTLIDKNLSNNSQNPVSEISYGTEKKQVSRLIFDLDLDLLLERISQGFIKADNIVSHTLHLTNTISNAEEYVGKRSYSLDIERASAISLDLFNVEEEWSEGSGYDFIFNDNSYVYVDILKKDPNGQAANWYQRKTDVNWTSGGSYQSGSTIILGSQELPKGSEDIVIDITDYVNGRIGLSGFTGTTHGLGIKFPDNIEDLETLYRQVVAFHVKDTHTFYEPYIETVIDDTIKDDRNYFYVNKDNDLYLYSNIGGNPENVIINSVNIYDHEDNVIGTATGDSIINVAKGVYKLTLYVDSSDYPDAVIFRDEWNVTVNGKSRVIENQFYLISEDKYFDFDFNSVNFSNYMFYFWGLKQKEKIMAGDIRKIDLSIKELYPNQDNFIPLDIEYRIFTTVGSKYQLDIIPFTSVNRTSKGYTINIDTGWLIPQDYVLELRLKNGSYYETKESINFSVVSNNIKK